MRAAVLEEVGAPLVVHDDLEVEEPRQGEVAVRVAHCGVCHSDLSVVDGTFPGILPIVLGHEAAGVVEAVGPGVTSTWPWATTWSSHPAPRAAPAPGACGASGRCAPTPTRS
jgi:S-(hydroxymethyl)glutathione dehydrogenase/alcohol dehydrogenase